MTGVGRSVRLAPLLPFALLSVTPGSHAIEFEQVAPILEKHCVLCHNGPGAPLGLQLDSRQGVLRGSRNGPVAVPGRSAESELIRRVRGDGRPRMPLTGPPWLTEKQITMIADWIDGGMAGSDTTAATRVLAKPPAPGEPVTFAHVERIFLQRCIKCHKDGGQMGPPPEALRLTDYDAVISGAERLVVVPGNPGMSMLLRRIRGQSAPRMPFDGPPWLSEAEIALIEQWIADGARDASGRPAAVPSGARVRLEGRLTDHWALDGTPFRVTGATRTKKNPQVGDVVEVRGRIGTDGQLEATRVRPR